MSIADVGAGSLIEFLTSSRVFEVKSWTPSGRGRTVHDVTHMRTSNIAGSDSTYAEKRTGRVIEPGKYSLVAHFDGTMTCPVLDGEESIQITRPTPPGYTTPHITTCTVAVVSEAAPLEIDGIQMWTIELEVLGAIAETSAA